MTKSVLITTSCLSALLLGGCATSPIVTSVDLAQGPPPEGSYIQYALPQTILVATISEVSGGGDKPAAATPTPTVVNNVYAAPDKTAAAAPAAGAADAKAAKGAKADPKAAKADAAPAKDPPKLAFDCKVLKDDYFRLSDANDAFRADEVKSLAGLETLTKGDTIPAAKVKQANDYVSRATAARADAAKRDAVAAQLVSDYEAACAKPLKIDVTAELATDSTRTYALVIKDDENSSDKLTAKPDENGLLTSVTTTADDKTGDIIVATAKSLVSVVYALDPTALVPTLALDKLALPAVAAAPPAPAPVGGGAGGAGGHNVAAPPKPPRKPAPKAVSTAKYHAFIFEARQLKPTHAYPVLKRQFPKAPSGPLRFSLTDFDGGKLTLLKTFSLQLDCASLKPVRATPSPTYSGVMVSTLTPCKLTTALVPRDGTPGDDEPVAQQAYFSAWNSRQPIPMPLNRTSLVSRTTTYGFSQGRVTSADYDKSSDALAAATLPGTIITGAISGLSTAIQGRQGVTKAEADRLNAQASVYTAQAALLDAKVKAAQSQDALEKAASHRRTERPSGPPS
jgi:hypothetical protein